MPWLGCCWPRPPALRRRGLSRSTWLGAPRIHGWARFECSRSGPLRPGRAFSVEADHAADAVLALHQLERVVDLIERHPVGDERVDVDLAVEVELHELRHLVAALDAAERRATHAAACDQVAGDDVKRLALPG